MKPNSQKVILAAALLLHSKIMEDQEKGRVVLKDSENYVFSEEKYIRQSPEQFEPEHVSTINEVPKIETIVNFMEALYNCAELSAESFIICSIYINRLITIADIPI